MPAMRDATTETKETLPGMTHAEVVRSLRRQVELMGSKALAARTWGVSPQMVAFVLDGRRRVGPKLCRALKLRRVRIVAYRFEDAASGGS